MYRVSTALCIDINSPSGKTENFQTALRGGREIVLEDSKVQQVSKKETTLVTFDSAADEHYTSYRFTVRSPPSESSKHKYKSINLLICS
jgi:hypothetical protein